MALQLIQLGLGALESISSLDGAEISIKLMAMEKRELQCLLYLL